MLADVKTNHRDIETRQYCIGTRLDKKKYKE